MNDWLRLFSGCGGVGGGPRGTCRQNLGTIGGAWALETYARPNAVYGDTILNECGNACKMTMNIIIKIGTLLLSFDW